MACHKGTVCPAWTIRSGNEEMMPLAILTQETVLKHFMERNAAIPVEDAYWKDQAIENHIERAGTGTAPALTNTLLLINPDIWQSIKDGSYFGDHDPPIPGGQLALTVDKEDIDRIITTRKVQDHYEVREDEDLLGPNVVDVTFLCQYDPANDLYTITHLEGLGQFM